MDKIGGLALDSISPEIRISTAPFLRAVPGNNLPALSKLPEVVLYVPKSGQTKYMCIALACYYFIPSKERIEDATITTQDI